MVITLTIILILFCSTIWNRIGRESFWADYVLVVYFLGIIGLMNFSQDWTVIRALNPYYALQLLVSPENKLGLFILGNIFLLQLVLKLYILI